MTHCCKTWVQYSPGDKLIHSLAVLLFYSVNRDKLCFFSIIIQNVRTSTINIIVAIQVTKLNHVYE